MDAAEDCEILLFMRPALITDRAISPLTAARGR